MTAIFLSAHHIKRIVVGSQRTGNKAMEPHRSLDIFRLREIEQQLTAELQRAREQYLRSKTEEQKRSALESRNRALQRLTEFIAKRIVPEEFR
jgi:hypothetical protein